MDITLINVIKVLLMSWFITSFSPLHNIIDFLKSLIKNPLLYIIVDTLHEMVKCFKCCSFWVGLLWFYNPWLGLISSWVAYLYTWKIQIWIERIDMPL